MAEVNKTKVMRKLDEMRDDDRMVLLNKYERKKEDCYCTFSSDQNIAVISKICLFKFSKNALVDSYMNGDPVVDRPGCRLDDFINHEVAA